MTRDTDLIRRGDAIKAVTDADRNCRGAHGARDNIAALPAHPVQKPPSPGVTAGATGGLIMQGLSDDTTGLARFGHHPNPAIDFCVEVEILASRLHQAEHGLSKPGTEPETVAAVLADIQRAMDFRVGGDEGAINAKHLLRKLEARATPAPVVPAARLARASVTNASAGWTLDFEMLQEFRAAAGDWGYSLDLEAVEQIALAVEARLRSAPPVGSRVTVKPGEIERAVWSAMIWAASNNAGFNGVPEYTDRGNSFAEDEARRAATRILAALLPAGEGEE